MSKKCLTQRRTCDSFYVEESRGTLAIYLVPYSNWWGMSRMLWEGFEVVIRQQTCFGLMLLVCTEEIATDRELKFAKSA
jgi:hypothetical protein